MCVVCSVGRGVGWRDLTVYRVKIRGSGTGGNGDESSGITLLSLLISFYVKTHLISLYYSFFIFFQRLEKEKEEAKAEFKRMFIVRFLFLVTLLYYVHIFIFHVFILHGYSVLYCFIFRSFYISFF